MLMMVGILGRLNRSSKNNHLHLSLLSTMKRTNSVTNSPILKTFLQMNLWVFSTISLSRKLLTSLRRRPLIMKLLCLPFLPSPQ
jgi:hypothetical protein